MAKYLCIKSDPGTNLFEGKTIVPYYEDSNELIYSGINGFDCHVKKDGQYFKDHLQEVK